MGAFQGNIKLLCEQAGALHAEMYVPSQQYLFECSSSKNQEAEFYFNGESLHDKSLQLLSLIEEEI